MDTKDHDAKDHHQVQEDKDAKDHCQVQKDKDATKITVKSRRTRTPRINRWVQKDKDGEKHKKMKW